MEEPRPILTIAILLCCVTLLVWVGVPGHIRNGRSSPKNGCINNLRLIDAAKQEWALEHGKTNSDVPTWAEIRSYFGRGGVVVLKCPSDGTYTLGALSNLPTCSIPGHVLPALTQQN